jgi:hypothetical protein
MYKVPNSVIRTSSGILCIAKIRLIILIAKNKGYVMF